MGSRWRQYAAASVEPAPSTPLADVREEGLRLARGALERGLPLRLVGGVAVWARCPSAQLGPLARSYGDVDVVIASGGRHNVTAYLAEMGYVPDKLFNALHGAQRLNFMDPVHTRPLDVLIDRMQMAHTIDLRRRLGADELTVPLADLLLTKLQVVALNDKDVKDIVALLADHPLGGAQEPDAVDTARLAEVLGADWGFEHTVRLNLAKLPALMEGRTLPADLSARVLERAEGIVAVLDRSKKTLAWRARAAVGEHVRWYEEPEEVRH
jgi:hypothetical protein